MPQSNNSIKHCKSKNRYIYIKLHIDGKRVILVILSVIHLHIYYLFYYKFAI